VGSREKEGFIGIKEGETLQQDRAVLTRNPTCSGLNQTRKKKIKGAASANQWRKKGRKCLAKGGAEQEERGIEESEST